MSKLFRGKNFGYLSTLMKDGSPQVTEIWVDIEDCNIIVKTAEGRLKHKNISRDPRIAICVVAQNNPYHMVIVRGRVVGKTNEGAEDSLAGTTSVHTFLGCFAVVLVLPTSFAEVRENRRPPAFLFLRTFSPYRRAS
jgi:PPOX class probable F420-dependent enzyme